MSAETTVRCDAEGCSAFTAPRGAAEPWWARLHAETERSWSTGDDGDYCPLHAPALEVPE